MSKTKISLKSTSDAVMADAKLPKIGQEKLGRFSVDAIAENAMNEHTF